MSNDLHIAVPGQRACEYRTMERDNCTLIFGALPAAVAKRLFSAFPNGATFDTDLARMTKATFAIGLPEDTQRLREAIADDVILFTRADYARHNLSDEAIRWLAVGEQGTSSQTMFGVLAGVKLYDEDELLKSHPSDPDDLRRCRLLLESVPELQERLSDMGGISPVWKNLVDNWSELCATMDAECPGWRSSGGKAAKTYELMKSLGC